MLSSWLALRVLTLFSATKFPSFFTSAALNLAPFVATIADPHFSFSSKQLFMVLSARGLGKKVGEMVSLDWHYKQGIKKLGQRTFEWCQALKLFSQPDQN